MQGIEVAIRWLKTKHARATIAVERFDDDFPMARAELTQSAKIAGDHSGWG